MIKPRNLSWVRKRCAPTVGAFRRDIGVHRKFSKFVLTLLGVSAVYGW